MSWRLIAIQDEDIPILRDRLNAPSYATRITGLWDRIWADWQKAAVQLEDIEHLMDVKCQKGKHDWDICSLHATGADSFRTRRCLRCLDRGIGIFQDQAIGYLLNRRGPWGPIEVRILNPDLLLPSRGNGEGRVNDEEARNG